MANVSHRRDNENTHLVANVMAIIAIVSKMELVVSNEFGQENIEEGVYVCLRSAGEKRERKNLSIKKCTLELKALMVNSSYLVSPRSPNSSAR